MCEVIVHPQHNLKRTQSYYSYHHLKQQLVLLTRLEGERGTRLVLSEALLLEKLNALHGHTTTIWRRVGELDS